MGSLTVLPAVLAKLADRVQIPAEVVIERGDASNVELTIAVHNLRERVEASDMVEPACALDT